VAEVIEGEDGEEVGDHGTVETVLKRIMMLFFETYGVMMERDQPSPM